MAADDIKPTRMQAAQAAARDFVKRQPLFVQTGVVAFSDTGLSVQVPTNDPGTVLDAINRLAPQSGTSVGQGILASLNVIASGASGGLPGEVYSNLLLTPTPTPTPVPHGTHTPAVIILLSDGENNENPDPLAAAQTAADRGVRIYTVGIGSPTGTTVHINGFSLHTQLDQATLQQISQITGGADFAKLVSTYSQDYSTRESGGDLGWFPRGVLTVPEVEDAAFSLQPGQTSPVVKSRLGYHIVQTIERDSARALSPSALEILRRQAVEQWLAQQMQKASIEIYI